MKALLYLEIRQVINSIKNTLRSPKRLIPLILIFGWVTTSLLSNIIITFGDHRNSRPNINILQNIPVETIEAVLFLLLSIGCLFTIYSAFNSGLLIFKIAQIDFMFPTPIKRRHVMLVKLFKDYISYGFLVTFFFVLIAPALYGSIGVSMMPLGIVAVLSLLGLLILVINLAHTINVIFTFGYERLKRARFIIKAVLIVAVISAALYGLRQYLLTGDSVTCVQWAANSPIISTIFAPVRWCTTLTLAPLLGMTAEDWQQLGMLWLLTVGSFVLLLSRKENIYEPSLGISLKFARRRKAMRTGDYAGVKIDALRDKGARRISGLKIPAFGRGATALLWKDLLIKYRVSRSQLLGMTILPIIITYAIAYAVKEAAILKYIPAIMLYLVWIMSMTVQSELRNDIKYANIIKAMPIPAWHVVFMGAIGRVLYLTAGVLVFAAAMWIIIPHSRGELLFACVIASPFLGFVNTSVSIIPSILYPDSNDMTQNYLSGIIGFFLMSIVLIPTIIIGIFSVLVLKSSFYTTAALISAANIIIGAAGIAIAGLVYRKFDPSSD